TYTGSAVDRDHYRHSAAHNTITVDGESSSVPAGPFSWRVRSDARVEDWFTGRVVDFFAGSHHGFERLRDPVRHLRRVLFVHHGYWVIHDTLFAAQAHDIVAHFHVAQGGTVIPQTESSAILRVQRGGRRTSVLLTALGDVASVSWDEDWLSPMYGARSRARIARVHAMAGAGRRDLLTVLTPVADGVPVSVTGATCEGGLTISIDRADVRDLLVFRLDGQARAHGTTTSADMTFVRRSQPNGPPDTVALFGASGRLELDVGVFQAQRAAEFQRQGQAWSIAGAGQVDPR
ncbi:MAG TPA: heparinase II/III-family protein, partial [Gemmatimonadaceae bacterium]